MKITSCERYSADGVAANDERPGRTEQLRTISLPMTENWHSPGGQRNHGQLALADVAEQSLVLAQKQ